MAWFRKRGRWGGCGEGDQGGWDKQRWDWWLRRWETVRWSGERAYGTQSWGGGLGWRVTPVAPGDKGGGGWERCLSAWTFILRAQTGQAWTNLWISSLDGHQNRRPMKACVRLAPGWPDSWVEWPHRKTCGQTELGTKRRLVGHGLGFTSLGWAAVTIDSISNWAAPRTQWGGRMVSGSWGLSRGLNRRDSASAFAFLWPGR